MGKRVAQVIVGIVGLFVLIGLAGPVGIAIGVTLVALVLIWAMFKTDSSGCLKFGCLALIVIPIIIAIVAYATD